MAKKVASADSHKHPANKCTKSVMHAHPNGKGKHAHRYSCQGGGQQANTGQGHLHPANSMTNSVRHSHPNGGTRKHTHHYGR